MELWTLVAGIVMAGILVVLALTFTGGESVSLSGKKILMIIAPRDFRDEELLIPKEYFENLGATVLVASKELDVCKGMLGAQIKPDLALRDVNIDDFDAVVFVGGAGVPVYYNDPEALRIAREAYEKGKVVGAICLAPGILASAGILNGKKATVWWTPQHTLGRDLLVRNGATLVDEPVVVDGRVVTANGPNAARAFAEAIAQLLTANDEPST